MKGIGPREFNQMRDLEELADRLGFTLGQSPFGNDNRFTIIPKDDQWPSYSRDARLYLGDMDEIVSFLKGLNLAREYYMIHLKLFTQARLERKEQDIRNQYLMDKLKEVDDDA